MTSEDKPLRLHPRRKTHAAGASRRIAFGLSVAAASTLASLMAERSKPTPPQPASIARSLPPATIDQTPIIVHVQVTRPPRVLPAPAAAASRVAPATSRGAAPTRASATTPPAVAPATPAPVVTSAPRSQPPTTVTRAS